MMSSDLNGVSSANGCGTKAEAVIGQAVVQQSVLLCWAGFDGMCPPTLQPGIVAAVAKAPLAATGLIASPSAHKMAMKSFITGGE